MNKWLALGWGVFGLALMIAAAFTQTPLMWVGGVACLIKSDTQRMVG